MLKVGAKILALIIGILAASALSQSTLLVGTQGQGFKLPEDFKVTFGDDLPYPVTWLSGKTVQVSKGVGTLRSANAR